MLSTAAALPPSAWLALDQQLLSDLLCTAVQTVDDAASSALQSSALRTLESALSEQLLLQLPRQVDMLLAATARACEGRAMSVRIAASGVAAACALALKGAVDHSTQQDAVANRSAQGGAAPFASDCSHSHSPPGTAHPTQNGVQKGHRCCAHCALSPDAWRLLQQTSLAAANGGEKARVHGMRAIGAVASVLPDLLQCRARCPQARDAKLQWGSWLGSAVSAVADALRAGSAKSTWNAAVAAGQVLLLAPRSYLPPDAPRSNSAPHESAQQALDTEEQTADRISIGTSTSDMLSQANGALAALPPALVHVLKTCANCKARIHAARALSAAAAQSAALLDPEALAAVVHSLATAVIAQQQGTESTPPRDEQPSTAPSGSATVSDAVQQAASNAPHLCSTDGADAAANAQYQAALHSALGDALLAATFTLDQAHVKALVATAGLASVVAALQCEMERHEAQAKTQAYSQVCTSVWLNLRCCCCCAEPSTVCSARVTIAHMTSALLCLVGKAHDI